MFSAGFTIPSLSGSSPTLTKTCQNDLSAYTLALARQYFQLVNTEVKSYDPNHLYLGCRFSYNYIIPEALQACAENADVISINIYEPRVNAAEWSYLSAYNKPCIVSEFHMGALDRGSYSPGLVCAPDQGTRASIFQDYVNSTLSLPMFVGVNWYQYVDQPTTSFALNGENGEIGFVSPTDLPYPEMVASARSVGQSLYTFRANATQVAVASASALLGRSVNLNATLSRIDSGFALQGKTLNFAFDGMAAGSLTTYSSGTAYFNYIPPAGTVPGAHTVTVSYAGDATDSLASGMGTLTIAAIPAALAVANCSGAPGASVTLNATLTRSDTNTPLPAKTVTFSVNGVKIGSALTQSSGQASVTYAIPSGTPPGSLPISVAFASDTYDNPASGLGTLAVVGIPAAISVQNVLGAAGASVRLSVTLTRSDTGAPLQGKALTFTLSGTTVGTATTYSSGSASLNYPIPANAAAGTLSVGVSFAGDATDQPCAGQGTLTVLDLPTAVAVDSVSGQAGHTSSLTATLTRSDTGAALPNRLLTFSINGAAIGTGQTYSTGKAYINYKPPLGTTGAQTITVTFAGDASDIASSGQGSLTLN